MTEAAAAILEALMQEVRDIMLKGLRNDFRRATGREGGPESLEGQTLQGYCGFAQSFLDCRLQDLGYVSKPFVIQSLGEKTQAAHVALVIDLETDEGVKKFLLDPTFRQFCNGAPRSPGTYLSNGPDGERITGSLVEKGYIELTPQVATAYLSAFCNGVCPFPTETEAMQFFAAPPEHEYNRYFPRQRLIADGYLNP